MIKKYTMTDNGRCNKIISALMLMFALTTLLSNETFGMRYEKSITPYGSYCKRMSHYGMHRSMIDIGQAEEALRHIYGKKGLSVRIVGDEGRFLKVEIRDAKKLVDIIIFDRKTGRIRSTY